MAVSRELVILSLDETLGITRASDLPEGFWRRSRKVGAGRLTPLGECYTLGSACYDRDTLGAATAVAEALTYGHVMAKTPAHARLAELAEDAIELRIYGGGLLAIISQQQDYAILVAPRSCKGCQR